MSITYTNSKKERLDKFLCTQFVDISRTQLQNHIKDGLVKVNNKAVAVHYWLRSGDKIDITEIDNIKKKKRIVSKIQFEPTIVEEDGSYLILNKPAGMLIHPTEQMETNTLADWIIHYNKNIAQVGEDPIRPGIVHRLDKDVGGLVIVAKTNESFEFLKSLFQERKIIKKYFSLVHGIIQSDGGEVTTPLKRNKETGRMTAESATGTGKAAHTKYTVLRRFLNYTYLDLQILTGRTHQIRAHLFSIGHSIVGDNLYKTKDLKKKTKSEMIKKPFLFAYHISFIDTDKNTQAFTLELPDHFKKILNEIF